MEMTYCGFTTRPEFDGQIYFGKLENVGDLVTIESETLADFEVEFHSAVEDYLEFRRNLAPRVKVG